jgi:DNA invertase Pin-like site-specific DNA recombinase
VKTAVAILRVSTDDQQNGIEAQRFAIEAWAAVHQVAVVAWFEEHISGKAPLEERVGLLGAIAEVENRKADMLLAHKRDRIARDDGLIPLLTERELRKVGAKLVTVDMKVDGDGPVDVFLRRVLDAVAELERGMIAARTKAALAAKKARGERVGAVPIGKRVEGGVLVDDDGEQRAIALARGLRGQGYSLRDIAVELELAGLRTRAGKGFAATQVARMVG